MVDDQSEEFRKFILDNRDIIEKILNEGKENEERASAREAAKQEIDQRIAESKEKAKETADAMIKIISDDDVQKHFINGCLEMIHFFDAIIQAAPLSPEAREYAEKLETARDRAVKNAVVVGAKDKMENININDMNSKPSAPGSGPGKAESIPIGIPNRNEE